MCKLCCSVLCRSSRPASTGPPLQTILRSRLHWSGKIFERTKTCTDPLFVLNTPIRGTVQVFERQSVLTVLQSVTEFAQLRVNAGVVDRKKINLFKKFFWTPCPWGHIDILPACSALNQIDLEAPCATFKKCYVLKRSSSIFNIDNITAYYRK